MMYSPRLVLSIERFPKEYTRLDRARSVCWQTTSYSSSAAYYGALPLAIFNFPGSHATVATDPISHRARRPGGPGTEGLHGAVLQPHVS